MSIYSPIKTCPRCKIDKNVSEYFKDKYQSDGLQNRCKSCDHIYGQNRKLYSRYGISLSEKNQMMELQDKKCGICNEETKLCVDHNHNKQGKESVRMLLCNSCNLMLGYAKDNIDILQKSIDYLKKYK
jgi:nitrate/TMAO reductase-like tetraheme cytochrome c subunit